MVFVSDNTQEEEEEEDIFRAYRVHDSPLSFLDYFHQHDRGADDQHDHRYRDHYNAGHHGGRAGFVQRLCRFVMVATGGHYAGRGLAVVHSSVSLVVQCRLLRVHLVQTSPQQHYTDRTPSDHLRHHDQVLGQRVTADRHITALYRSRISHCTVPRPSFLKNRKNIVYIGTVTMKWANRARIVPCVLIQFECLSITPSS